MHSHKNLQNINWLHHIKKNWLCHCTLSLQKRKSYKISEWYHNQLWNHKDPTNGKIAICNFSFIHDIAILQLWRVFFENILFRTQKLFSKIINLLQNKAFYYKIMLLISVSKYHIKILGWDTDHLIAFHSIAKYSMKVEYNSSDYIHLSILLSLWWLLKFCEFQEFSMTTGLSWQSFLFPITF